MPDVRDLTVGVVNIERFGDDPDRGHHRLSAELEFLLEHTPVPPDVLAPPEVTHGLADRQRAIRRHTVARLFPNLDSGWYEPLFAHRPPRGRKNHVHLLLVKTAKVQPLGWAHPESPEETGRRHHGWVQCEIFGHEVTLCCEHWPGGDGRETFERSANRISNRGGPKRKSLILGDFNADSGSVRELHRVNRLNWYQQCRDQGNLDKLRQKGWFNPGGVDPATDEAGWYWPSDTRQIKTLRTIFGYLDLSPKRISRLGDPLPRSATAMRNLGPRLRVRRLPRPGPSSSSPSTVDTGIDLRTRKGRMASDEATRQRTARETWSHRPEGSGTHRHGAAFSPHAHEG